jgi:fumarate reductase flavoprotein subunit
VRSERRGAAQALGGRVLLACGGFAGDDALIAEHCPAVAALPYQGGSRAAGEGLRLGREAGAALRRLASCLVTPFLATPGQLVVTTPLVALGAILVNQAGKRFADETGESPSLATAVRGQPGRLAYLFFGERTAAAARTADPFFARVVLPRSGRRGATLEDLAKQLELDADGLRLTVETVSGSIERGEADAFGRRSFAAEFEPPFHAMRVSGARCSTLGGLAVDGTARVLDAQGQPIPGLYAAGGTAAGLGGEATEGQLLGLDTLTALGLGRLAALDVIAHAAAAPGGDEPA